MIRADCILYCRHNLKYAYASCDIAICRKRRLWSLSVLLIATRADDPAVAVHSAIVPYHNYKRMRYCVYYRVPTFG